MQPLSQQNLIVAKDLSESVGLSLLAIRWTILRFIEQRNPIHTAIHLFSKLQTAQYVLTKIPRVYKKELAIITEFAVSALLTERNTTPSGPIRQTEFTNKHKKIFFIVLSEKKKELASKANKVISEEYPSSLISMPLN